VFDFFVHLSFICFSVIATSFLLNKGEYNVLFYYCVDDYTFAVCVTVYFAELNLKCRCTSTSASMATCDVFMDYFSELNDIEQENVGTEAADEDSLRAPDGLPVVD